MEIYGFQLPGLGFKVMMKKIDHGGLFGFKERV
jgi:hypothetical protein